MELWEWPKSLKEWRRSSLNWRSREVNVLLTDTCYHGCTHISFSSGGGPKPFPACRYWSFERWGPAFIYVLGQGMRFNTKFLLMIQLDNLSSNSLYDSWLCHMPPWRWICSSFSWTAAPTERSHDWSEGTVLHLMENNEVTGLMTSAANNHEDPLKL